ncbi:phospholipase [Pseudomonas sp. gcc21]|uniref:phospholipase D-like domain-containing protein n=1 Tax=Pseudomonas sp. gcc21 TaxID=2726989 RepID=UPI001451D1AE|nr:phospholipase D-like domain-containing protein [Pseudomonas sp. gcc21]QJD59576.1 phospholipase [Pseudomonas sp. gcc21]
MDALARLNRPRRHLRLRSRIALVFLLTWVALALYQATRPLPPGMSFTGPLRPASDLALLTDQTYRSTEGEAVSEQQIFDEVFRLIGQARKLIVVDMFLFNEFSAQDSYRGLTGQMTDALIAARQTQPDIQVVLITDPFNHLYGGIRSTHLERLDEAGVQIVYSNINQLPASNPVWSGLWMLCCSWVGNNPDGGWLPNPVADTDVTLRTYLHLLNFRANHRKTLVVDQGNDWVGLVTSANPQDASSRHSNTAIRFSGAAALDLLQTERAVLEMSDAAAGVGWPQPPEPASEVIDPAIQVLTEGAIRDALLDMINSAERGDRLDMEVFYLSHRPVISALIRAHQRGVNIRAILDPNRDAFGREKNGIPNRQAAWDLHKAGIELRWCFTQGEQCHRKWIRLERANGTAELISGSANFTRRNLDDLNQETSVRLVASQHPALDESRQVFEKVWSNANGATYSQPYGTFADHSWARYALYRLMEATGLSTF